MLSRKDPANTTLQRIHQDEMSTTRGCSRGSQEWVWHTHQHNQYNSGCYTLTNIPNITWMWYTLQTLDRSVHTTHTGSVYTTDADPSHTSSHFTSIHTTHTGSVHTTHTGSIHTTHTGSIHTTHTGSVHI